MTFAKQSAFLVTRLTFVFFSVMFVVSAFDKWDGYSYYMQFADFLPDLSAAYVIWILLSIIPALFLWAVLYFTLHITIRLGFSLTINHFLVFIIGSVALKKIASFLIASYFWEYGFLEGWKIWFICLTVVAVLVMVIRSICDRLITEINTRITPLVWLFFASFVLAVPLSFIQTGNSENVFESDPAIKKELETAKGRPNIVLVVIDTLAALDMQLYGYNRDTTPFISEWAEGSSVFSNLYASSNWTTASTVSILTGQRPWTHKVWYQALYRGSKEQHRSLPYLLKDQGYDLYSFVQNPSAHPDVLGFEGAFSVREKYYRYWSENAWWYDRFVEAFYDRPVLERWIFREYNHIALRVLNLFRPALAETFFPADLVYDDVLKTVAGDRDVERPFFAWIQVLPPHDPYLPPAPYLGRYGNGDVFKTDEFQSGLIHIEYEKSDQPKIDDLRRRYDEFIRYSDHEFGEFMTQLEHTVDMNNTVVILVSDHGESFSSGFQGHGSDFMYESVIHVPMIIKMPSVGQGIKIDTLVEHIDIMPTILDIAAIDIPLWSEGRSLLPAIKGEEIVTRPVYSMQLIKNRILPEPIIKKGVVAMRSGSLKLIYDIGMEKSVLYNLDVDPEEQLDIASTLPMVVNEYEYLIKQELKMANELNERVP